MAPREAIEVEGERPAPRQESPSAQGSRSVEDAAPRLSLVADNEGVQPSGPWSLALRLEMLADNLARCRDLLEHPRLGLRCEAEQVAGRLRVFEADLLILLDRLGVDHSSGVESLDAFDN